MFTRLQIIRMMGWFGAAALFSKYTSTPLHAETMTLDAAVQAQLGVGVSALKPSGQVTLKVPQMAENGASVPIDVSTSIPADQVEGIYIFVDKNPRPFIMKMSVYPLAGQAGFATNIKMSEESNVRAVVKTKSNQLHMAMQNVRVTAGGCN